MEQLYNKNGILFFSEKEIEFRENCEKEIRRTIYENLKGQNKTFEMVKIEAPILTPLELINKNYTNDDFYSVDGMVLRPETTMGSYEFAKNILSGGYGQIKYRAPIIIYQHGKSFRKEQDQTVKFMRLKEFYQLEFQIIFFPNTENDYSLSLYEEIRKTLSKILAKECRMEESDRLPSYSEQTIDIICNENNMEIASMSKRKDLQGYKVIEIAIGTDRLIYNYFN